MVVYVSYVIIDVSYMTKYVSYMFKYIYYINVFEHCEMFFPGHLFAIFMAWTEKFLFQ